MVLKNQISFINSNFKQKYFSISLSDLEEKIFFLFHSKLEEKILNNNDEIQKNPTLIFKAHFTLKEFHQIFEVKGNVRTRIIKSLDNLKLLKLRVINDSGIEGSMNVFDNLKKTEKGIECLFNQNYLGLIFSRLQQGWYLSLRKELVNFKSKYSPKLLRLFKSNVSLGVSEIDIVVKKDDLKRVLFGDKWETTYKNKTVFNQKVLQTALKEINGMNDNGERNTFVSAKLVNQFSKYNEVKEIEEDYYQFKVSSSEEVLKTIEYDAKNKSTATYKALEDFSNGIINNVDYRRQIEPKKADKDKKVELEDMIDNLIDSDSD